MVEPERGEGRWLIAFDRAAAQWSQPDFLRLLTAHRLRSHPPARSAVKAATKSCQPALTLGP